MDLTEKQALEIAYSFTGKNIFGYKFIDYKNDYKIYGQIYDYELRVKKSGLAIGGHDVQFYYEVFKFSKNQSVMISRFGDETDITKYVNNFLKECNANAGTSV